MNFVRFCCKKKHGHTNLTLQMLQNHLSVVTWVFEYWETTLYITILVHPYYTVKKSSSTTQHHLIFECYTKQWYLQTNCVQLAPNPDFISSIAPVFEDILWIVVSYTRGWDGLKALPFNSWHESAVSTFSKHLFHF